MANTSNSDKWYFTKEQLENTPSRKCGYDSYKELSHRQQAANFIQDMGQRLKVSQLCINTAIVYMHRFYVFHSFTHFPWHQMAAAALFLAAKVEEQPRKLEYVIRAVNICRNPRDTNFDINSERYIAQSQDLVFNENVLLQTLGFDVAIDHPHTHVVRCCHLVRASKDLAQTSYFMASNSLHLTTMCIQYKPTVVACFCIMVACKWSNWEIPLSNERKEWFSYVDPTVTSELLSQLTEEFLVIFESCPSRLKEKIMAIAETASNVAPPHINSPFAKYRVNISDHDAHKHRSNATAPSSGQQQRDREYRERKERERLAQHGQKHAPAPKAGHSGHHKPPTAAAGGAAPSSADPKLKQHSRPSASAPGFGGPVQPRDILREAARDSPFAAQPPRDKEQKQNRDYLLKPNAAEPTSLNAYADNRYGGGDKRAPDPSRPRVDSATKYPPKPPHQPKPEEAAKKQPPPPHGYPTKPTTNSTSQKMKSPFDSSKSVPKPNAAAAPLGAAQPKTAHYNGNSNGAAYNLPLLDSIKSEAKELIQPPAQIKRPSLFSPEKTPPHKVPMSAPTIKLDPEPEPLLSFPALSPLSSPVGKRSRNYSSSSDAELRPVMKKIDQVEGFENLVRDSTIGINHLQVPPVMDVKTEPQSLGLVNGIETNPTLISNLLKEAPPVSHLSGVASASSSGVSSEFGHQMTELKEKDHHHHKSKKKNKEKHKHKDKDKSREEKEKKKKHKDKDREKHRHKDKHEAVSSADVVSNEPIKIKIHKDKILPEQPPPAPIGLKIKIPKDKIKTEDIGEPSRTAPNQYNNTAPPPFTGGIKIKIPKEVISSCAMDNGSTLHSKKRERDRHSSAHHHDPVPPAKISKSSYKDSSKHSYSSKVSNTHSQHYAGPAPRYAHPPPMRTAPMYRPPPMQHAYMYPPPGGMAVPPPQPAPSATAAQQAYMYPADAAPMYAYYNQYMYPQQVAAVEMFHHQQQQQQQFAASLSSTLNCGNAPPLPADAPPDVPPPPPPE